LYSFQYYIAPNTTDVCYGKYQIKLTDSVTFVPLEAILPEIVKSLIVDVMVKSEYDFAFDKNNFYIDGEVVYASNKKTFKIAQMPNLGKNGSIIVNKKEYSVIMTGLVGATLKYKSSNILP